MLNFKGIWTAYVVYYAGLCDNNTQLMHSKLIVGIRNSFHPVKTCPRIIIELGKTYQSNIRHRYDVYSIIWQYLWGAGMVICLGRGADLHIWLNWCHCHTLPLASVSRLFLVLVHLDLLHPSNTIHGILPVQFTCLTVFFHNLSPSFLWSTSGPGTLLFILHTFLHPTVVFLFSTHAHTIATCFAVDWDYVV